MLMNKRGQATVFIIIGIVIVVLVLLYLLLTQTRVIQPILGGSSVNEQMGDVDDHITECIRP